MNNQGKNKLFFVPIAWEGDDVPETPALPSIIEIPIGAASAALITGIQAAMQEGNNSMQEWRDGKINEAQYTNRIVHKGTQGAMKGGIRTAGAIGLSQGLRMAITKKWGEQVLKRLTRFNFLGSVCYGIVDQTSHTIQLFSGNLNQRDYKVKSVENVGSTGGAIGGAALGSVLGSVVPGLGTGTGMLIGGMLSMMGAMGGANVGKQIGEEWFPHEEGNKQAPQAAENKE
ncbi:MAG: hypothetical protein AAFY71_22375 [Bacteroidota bacterium]